MRFYVTGELSLILSYKFGRKIMALFEKYGNILRNSFLVRFLLINSLFYRERNLNMTFLEIIVTKLFIVP